MPLDQLKSCKVAKKGTLHLWWTSLTTLFKNPTHALCFKIHTKTQSLFKTLECLCVLCHPTCFGHTLDHLQWMFLVQCCFPPCCFVTILLGYVVVSSICVVVMCTSLLVVIVHNKTESREVHMTTTQTEDTATYPSKNVTKQQGGKQHCTRNIPWRW
jgi:hypothetical protein